MRSFGKGRAADVIAPAPWSATPTKVYGSTAWEATLPRTVPYRKQTAAADLNRAKTPEKSGEPRWNLAFAGLMLYLFVEYSRLPEMYPVLQPLRLGKLALALTVIGYILLPRTRSPERTASQALDFAVLLLVVANVFSACFAFPQDQVWGNLLDEVTWGAVYFLVARILTGKWQIRTLLFLLLLLNLKLAQHTVRSYIADRSAGVSDMRIIMTGGAGEGTSSFFGNVADLGLAMDVVWGIVWALLLGRAEKKRFPRAFLILCFVVFLLAILLCGSRGAVVGAAAIAFVALGKSPKKIGALLLGLVFIVGVWFVLPGASKERFRSAWDWQHDANASSRVMFWKIGLEMFEDNPIFGVGPGNFALVNPYHFVSHSLYIQVLAESGTVGTLALAAIVICISRVNGRTRKHVLAAGPEGRQSFEYCLALGLDLGMVGYLASGAFLSVLYYPHLWILAGLSVATNRLAVSKFKSLPVEQPLHGRFALSAR